MTEPTNRNTVSQETMTKKERFLGAISGVPLDRPPIWLMRQAGRYIPAYQKVKERYTFQEMCRIPDVAAEVSIQPLNLFNMDAVIVFNDILIPFEQMGLAVDYTDNGPVISPPVRNERDAEHVHVGVFDETPPVFDSIGRIRRRVGGSVPILGFAGAPFTMAAYMVEGLMSKNLRYIKELLYSQSDLLRELLHIITETVIEYLRIQIQAGADVVQIFDTWAGALSQEDYRRFAAPYQRMIIDAIQNDGAPVILYVKDSTPFIKEMKESGASVLSVDWRVDLRNVYEIAGGEVALQGNLDPTVLFSSPEVISDSALSVLNNFGRDTGHIFNLGHGVLPGTPVENVQALIETVQSYEYVHISSQT